MSERSPGPWQLVASDGETVVVGPNDEYVAFIANDELPNDPDGILVAAAPTLLDALKKWSVWASEWSESIARSLPVDDAARLREATKATKEALREVGGE